jgi:hypothetical protein
MTVGVLLYAGWAAASAVVYAIVLWLAVRQLQRHRDRRSRRELYMASALFITSLASLTGVMLALADGDRLVRLGTTALALGAYLGAGIVIALEYLRREREA